MRSEKEKVKYQGGYVQYTYCSFGFGGGIPGIFTNKKSGAGTYPFFTLVIWIIQAILLSNSLLKTPTNKLNIPLTYETLTTTRLIQKERNTKTMGGFRIWKIILY